ncbi:MAG: ExbD/TolR family protein, partial [Gemmatimonadota bacterium]
LLIFFMVSTTFPKEQQRDIAIPQAQETQKLDEPRDNILHLWVEQNGDIYINDRLVPTEQVSDMVAPLYRETQQRLIVNIRADSRVPYRFVDAVQKELQEANAVRVAFYTDLEQRVTRRRR